MIDKRVILPLLLILGLGVGAVLVSDNSSELPNQSTPSQPGVPSSTSTHSEGSSLQAGPSGMQRSNLAAKEEPSEDGWFTIELVGNEADPIIEGQLAWIPAEPFGSKPQAILPEQNGTFKVFSNNNPGWLLAEAKSYWPRKVPLKPDSEPDLVIRLDLVDSHSSFSCREEPGSRLAPDVKFIVDYATPSSNPRAFSSDSNGHLRLPIEGDGVFNIRVDRESEDRYAPFTYSLRTTDKEIPIFKKCRARVFVTQDGGAIVPKGPIGVAPCYYRPGQVGRIVASLDGFESFGDQEGQIELELVLGIPQTIWALDQDRGYSSILVTPLAEYQEYSIVVGKPSPLVLDIALPDDVPHEFLKVVAHKRDGTASDLFPESNGVFQIDSPIDVQKLEISAKGCQTVQGFLPDLRRKSDGKQSMSGGFLRWELERGHTVKGLVKWTDGTPATTGVFMLPLEGPGKTAPEEQYGASEWRWALLPPLTSQQLDSHGNFEFSDVPPGTYVLDQLDEEGGRSSRTAFSTYFGPENYIEVPIAQAVELTFSRLRKVELHVTDGQTGESIPAFTLQRAGAGQGFYGRSGHGEEGLFVGSLPVDELASIEIIADGYLPEALEELQVNEKDDRLVRKMRLKKINPGFLEVNIDGLDQFIGESIAIRVSDLGNHDGENSEPETSWTDFFECKPGDKYQLLVPVEGLTTLEFTLSKESQRNLYRISQQKMTYAPGQSISIFIEPIVAPKK